MNAAEITSVVRDVLTQIYPGSTFRDWLQIFQIACMAITIACNVFTICVFARMK